MKQLNGFKLKFFLHKVLCFIWMGMVIFLCNSDEDLIFLGQASMVIKNDLEKKKSFLYKKKTP